MYLHTTADPARKCCSAGRYRSPDNVCKDCPIKTWSKDAANICCPDGQYEGSDALCENCPPGTYLKWRTERSSEKNKCRTCGKGKVGENKQIYISSLKQFIFDYRRKILAFICHMTLSIQRLFIFTSSLICSLISIFS
jgi:hypothetical protein